MFLQPGFTLASHCITLTNSSYTQAGIEQTLNNWTTSGTLPGFMQKNYVGSYCVLNFFWSHTYILTDMHVNVRIYTGWSSQYACIHSRIYVEYINNTRFTCFCFLRTLLSDSVAVDSAAARLHLHPRESGAHTTATRTTLPAWDTTATSPYPISAAPAAQDPALHPATLQTTKPTMLSYTPLSCRTLCPTLIWIASTHAMARSMLRCAQEWRL